MNSENVMFILYIAVNDKTQSKGYGSEILKKLQEECHNKPISLFIEMLDPKVDNYEQRVKRLAFYERNGYTNLNIKAGFKKPELDILSTKKDFSVEECKKMLKGTPIKIFE